MNEVREPNERLANIVPYDPKYLPATAFLSANENPCNVPEPVTHEIARRLKKLNFNRYPDPLATELRVMIAEANGLDPENVLVGNGGDELLFNLALAWGGQGRVFLNLPPTFSVYEQNARLTDTDIVNIDRKPDFSINEQAVLERVSAGDIDFMVVASPNNPSGDLASDEFLSRLLRATDALVLVDEAYFEFSRSTMRPYLAEHRNLVILRTFSKAFSLAGVRVGYIIGAPEVITQFVKVRQPYSVDAVAQHIAAAAFAHRSHFEKGIMAIIKQRESVFNELMKLPEIEVFPSSANYLLFRVPNAHEIWKGLYDQGILVRDFSASPGLDNCLRVTIGLEAENRAFLMALVKLLEERGRV